MKICNIILGVATNDLDSIAHDQQPSTVATICELNRPMISFKVVQILNKIDC